MEQHPVPQHIASFEFKLFGNLTVRQFISLSIPLSIAALIFFSNLTPILKYPLVGIFALLGFIAALVPIQGRPLDKWVIAFARAILSPTQRIWIKEAKVPEFLNVVVAPLAREEHIPEEVTAQGRERLLAYVRSLPKGQFTPLDVKEQISLQRLDLGEYGQYSQTPQDTAKLPAPIIWPTQTISGKPIYAQISLPQVAPVSPLTTAQTQPASKPPLPTVKISPHAKPYALPGLEKKLGAKPPHIEPIELITYLDQRLPQEVEIKTPRHLASDINFSEDIVIPIKTPDKRLTFLHGVGKTRVRKLHFAPPAGFDLSKLPIRGEKRFEISQELKKRFQFLEENTANNLPAATPPPQAHLPTAKSEDPSRKQPASKTMSLPKQAHFVPKATHHITAQDVSFKQPEKPIVDTRISTTGQKSKSAPLPASVLTKAKIIPLTDKPNVLSGQVTDRDNNPIEGAIFIVRDQNGIPVRALRTSRLGQFLSVTPLASGQYIVEVESASANFDPFTINLDGRVAAPLEIRAK